MKTSVKKRVALGGSLIASIGVVAIIVVGMTLGLYGTSQASTGSGFSGGVGGGGGGGGGGSW